MFLKAKHLLDALKEFPKNRTDFNSKARNIRFGSIIDAYLGYMKKFWTKCFITIDYNVYIFKSYQALTINNFRA